MNADERQALENRIGPVLARNIAPPMITIAVDGACPITEDAFIRMTKAGVLALSVAAPGTDNIGRILKIYGTTADQNVITFTGGTLRSGAAGVTTVTGAAQIGSGITVQATTATVWQLLSNTLAVIS